MSKDTEKKEKTGQDEKKSQKVAVKETKAPTQKKRQRVANRPIPAWAYCNIIGLSTGLRVTVKKRFGSLGRKTADQWKEIFTKEGLL